MDQAVCPAGTVGTGRPPDLPTRVVWLSLDESDNAPDRFWAHLVAALQTGHANVSEMALALLSSPGEYPIEQTITVLLDEIQLWNGSTSV